MSARALVLAALAPLVLVGAGAVTIGCSSDDPQLRDSAPVCQLPFLGDKTRPVELEVTARDALGNAALVADGGDVSILFPPQGGRVIFLGVRAKNLDPCGVRLNGAIRDTATKQVRIDNRTMNLVPRDDGFGASVDSDISTFSNVPVCPNQWASADVYDHPYEIEVTVEDVDGRSATQKLTVTPRCDEAGREDECRCICRKGYILGSKCDPSDAGASDAGTDASDASDVGDAADGGR